MALTGTALEWTATRDDVIYNNLDCVDGAEHCEYGEEDAEENQAHRPVDGAHSESREVRSSQIEVGRPTKNSRSSSEGALWSNGVAIRGWGTARARVTLCKRWGRRGWRWRVVPRGFS